MSTTGEQTTAKSMRGDFVWHELRTTDRKAAEEFYTHVVGWETMGSGDPGGVPYTLLTTQGKGAAGLMELTPEMRESGMQPAWMGFVGVDDVDEDAKRLEAAGGKLHCEPMDIPGIGRFVSVEDPQGAAFLLFKGNREPAPEPLPFGTTGTVGWNELSANDGVGVWPFYSVLFGWKVDTDMDMGSMGIYRIFNNGGPRIGAMMTRGEGSPRPFWLFYFAIDDIDAAAARIKEKHGQICMGPHEVPGPVWIVVAMDPQGAMFAVVGPRKQ